MVTRAAFNTWLASRLDPVALRKGPGEGGFPEWVMIEIPVTNSAGAVLGMQRVTLNEETVWREHTLDPSGRRGAREIGPGDRFDLLPEPALEAYLRTKGWAAWLP